MAKVSFKRINNSSDLSSLTVSDGSFIVTGDGKSYVDFGNKRVPIGGTPDHDVSTSSTNAVANNAITNYVNEQLDSMQEDIGFTTEQKGNWFIKKYNDGLMEMYYEESMNISLDSGYGSAWWTAKVFNYPETLVDIINVQSNALCVGHLIGTNPHIVAYTHCELFIYDFWQHLQNQPMTIYITIIGHWK